MNRDTEILLSFLAPIRDLLLDEHVSEIMGNPNGSWWFEKEGKVYPADNLSFGAAELRTGLEVIANRYGRKMTEDCPLLNVQLPDGSRLAAALPPVVRPFPSITIRKFATDRLSIVDLVNKGMLTKDAARYLHDQIRAGRTMLISGGTSSGKTTLLNALTDFIPDDERLVVLEDTAELRISKQNILGAECQATNPENPIDFPTLLRASLRWRPDRIIVGEVRGDEARTLLDSFNTGHAGSMATIHASSALRALHRFCELAMRSHQQTTRDDVAAEIAESVHVVVQVQRFAAVRSVSEIIEVGGYDRDRKMFISQSLFPHNETVSQPRKELIHAIA